MSQAAAPEPRIGDSEREAAVHALGEHYAAGRLTKDEYDERAAVAFEARTASALWPLFADLPRPQAQQPPPAASSRPQRPSPPARSGRPGWWSGARLMPVFLVVLALAIFGPMPWFVVFILGAVMWFTSARHWQHRSGASWSGCGSSRSR